MLNHWKYGRGSQLSVPKEEFNEDFFFFEFEKLKYFEGIVNFDFFFFEKFGNLEFFQGIENFD